MVQVETLGELGVFFTLFVVGLEFSPERLRKVNEESFWVNTQFFREWRDFWTPDKDKSGTDTHTARADLKAAFITVLLCI